MINFLNEKIKNLAKDAKAPIYLVGGSVRDFLAGLSPNDSDFDICAPISVEEFSSYAVEKGFIIQSIYKTTGVVKISDGENEYEFASFRNDRYIRGQHTPTQVVFTTDILLDSKRRDFKANAVYYDIALEKFVDPLGGIEDIKNHIFSTVREADRVFGEDGLRLMRLCRQSAQTGFLPNKECADGARKNASLISDISPERIFAELKAILIADKKYNNPNGHFTGIKLLDEIGVLDIILPELTLGKGVAQRADFHKYDMFNHSLRALLYAPEEIRLAALLHDIGKPFCFFRDGNVHEHPNEGERIARDILTRLKAPKADTEKICALIKWHMYDFDGKTKENKLRRFFVENLSILEDLMKLKQTDFSACTDDISECPTNKKWKLILQKMETENAPLTLKDLKITGNEIVEIGAKGPEISQCLHSLLLQAVIDPTLNTNNNLKRAAMSYLISLRKQTNKKD